MKELIRRLLPATDLLAFPLVYPAALLLKGVRRAGVHRMPLSKRALLQVGVFPIRNHYYEPQFGSFEEQTPLAQDRSLPGIEWNVTGQLAFMEQFTYADELANLPSTPSSRPTFRLGNGSFESGDAECWYQLLRAIRPKRIIEIGSGNSTLMAQRALEQNRADDPDYRCEHICIEPYEMPWLEQSGVTVLRKKVEDIDVSFFAQLEANDILFIDSSHIIRPQGDVVFEYLEILPTLKPGVIVHVHDIFSPRNYPSRWISDEVLFWNEQYLLEAFLSHNRDWKVLLAVNHLRHHHYERLSVAAPFLTPDREPGSFYIQRVS